MIVEGLNVFSGNQLRERFAYNVFGYSRTMAIGNIISFCGSLDYRNKDKFLGGDECIHFCVELPEYDRRAGVLFNRLFLTNVGQILSTNFLHVPIQITQDSLVVEKAHFQGGVEQKNGVVSVNLCSQVHGAFMIYLGLYNKGGESAPARAFSMGLNASETNQLMEEVNSSFYFLANDIFLGTCRVV